MAKFYRDQLSVEHKGQVRKFLQDPMELHKAEMKALEKEKAQEEEQKRKEKADKDLHAKAKKKSAVRRKTAEGQLIPDQSSKAEPKPAVPSQAPEGGVVFQNPMPPSAETAPPLADGDKSMMSAPEEPQPGSHLDPENLLGSRWEPG